MASIKRRGVVTGGLVAGLVLANVLVPPRNAL